MEPSERLSRLEALVAASPALERDVEVIHLQLTRAEGKLERGDRDVRAELRIVEQRLDRAERRITRAVGPESATEQGNLSKLTPT